MVVEIMFAFPQNEICCCFIVEHTVLVFLKWFYCVLNEWVKVIGHCALNRDVLEK